MDNNKSMVSVYDHTDKEIKQQLDRLVHEGVSSGRYTLESNKKYNVLDPYGKHHTISGDEGYDAFNAGWTLEPYDFRKKREDEEKYEGLVGTAEAFGAGGLRGVSLGLSDLGLTKSGAADPETLRELQERNPIASTAGEVLGVVGSLFYGGAQAKAAQMAGKAAVKGASAIAKRATAKQIAKRYINAPQLVSEAGEAVTKLIVRDGTHQGLKLAGKAAGSAIEGAFYGLGHAVSEDALGKADFTAEVLPAMTEGLLFGAAIPPVFKGAELVAKKSLPVIRDMANGVLDSVSSVTGKTYAKITSAVSGVEEETARKLFAKPFREKEAGIRKAAMMSPDEVLSFSKDMKANLDVLEDSIDGFFEATYKGKKRDKALKLLGKEDFRGQGDVTDIAMLLRGAKEKAIKMTVDEPIHNKSLLTQYQNITDKSIDDFRNLMNREAPVKNHEIFSLIDDTKNRFQALAKYDTALSDPGTKATAGVVRDTAYTFKKHLEGWEGKLGTMQKDYNKAVSEFMDARKDFHKAFADSKTTRGKKVHTISATKVNAYINQMSKLSGEKREDILQDYFDKVFKYEKEMGKMWSSAEPELATISPTVLAAIGDQVATTQNLKTIKTNLKWKQELDKMKGQMFDQGIGLSEVGLAGSLGLVLKDFSIGPGAMAAAATVYGLAKNPYNSMRVLSALERMQGAVVKKVMSASKAIVSKVPIAGKKVPASYGVLLRQDLFGRNKKDNPKSRSKGLKLITERLDNASLNPVKFMEEMDDQLSLMGGFAPKTVEAVKMQKIMALNFLNQKIPRSSSTNIFQKDKAFTPSDFELSKFERYLGAATNPLSVLDDLENGHMNNEGVETLRAIYPQIYQQVVEKVMHEISEADTIAYSRRLQLSKLLGFDITNTLSPQKINVFQSTYEPQEEAQSETIRGNINLKDSQYTEMQKVEKTS